MQKIYLLVYNSLIQYLKFANMRGIVKKLFFYPLLLMLLMLHGCDKNVVVDRNPTQNLKGTGSFTYTDYPPFADKPIEVYYHIPEDLKSNAPVLVAFHGNSRDALESRNALISKANSKGFIVVVPLFSSTYFPGSDTYQLANVFTDGDNPSAQSLNPKEEWTFSVIEPLVSYIKNSTGNSSIGFDVFGHSAGAQFAHRYFLLEPNNNINRMACAAAGWYTVTDNAIDFPYGLNKCPVNLNELAPCFAKSVFVLVGENDTDPTSFNLRHNTASDAQGLNRLERAQHFFERAKSAAMQQNFNFTWEFKVVPNAGHNFEANAKFAVDLLY